MGHWPPILPPLSDSKCNITFHSLSHSPHTRQLPHLPTSHHYHVIHSNAHSFPWFFTFNTLQEYIPKPDQDKTFQKFGRNAFIGFTSSVISDCCSNSLRVIKTTKQTNQVPISYPQAIKMVLDADGIIGLFGRGLRTRIIANGFQGLTFSVIWKALEEKWNKGVN